MLLKDFNYKNDFRDISSEISLLPESRKSVYWKTTILFTSEVQESLWIPKDQLCTSFSSTVVKRIECLY